MMKYRKQIAIAVVALLGLYYVGGSFLGGSGSGAADTRRKRIETLKSDISKAELKVKESKAALADLEVYKALSLPSNAEVARSLYQAWLLKLVERAKLANPNVDSGEPANRKGGYKVLTYSIRGKGSLEQLTKFLFEFYGAAHLHQIRSLTIMPLQGQDQLDLALSIEALVLPSADRKDELSTKESHRLVYDDLDDYRVIVQRNLFGVGGSADASDNTYLTSVNYVNGQPEVWFSVRTTDSLMRLHKGDALEVGTFKGTVADVFDNDVVLEADGERWLITVGECLTHASALPPEF